MSQAIVSQVIISQDIILYHEYQDMILTSSPTSVSWFIDRTGDRTILQYQRQEIINNSFIPFINNIPDFIIDNTLDDENTFVLIVVDEHMVVTEEQHECCICMDQQKQTNICKLTCAHTYCSDCISSTLSSQFSRYQDFTCPLCRGEVTSVLVQNIESKNKFHFR